MGRPIRSIFGNHKVQQGTNSGHGLDSPRLPTEGWGLDQYPRRRFIEEIELAIVRETKATIANERMTTTTGNSLLTTRKRRAGRLPNSTFVLSITYIENV